MSYLQSKIIIVLYRGPLSLGRVTTVTSPRHSPQIQTGSASDGDSLEENSEVVCSNGKEN